MDFDYTVIGKHIQQYRLDLNKTQEEIAKKADIPQGTISNIYKRNNIPTISTLSAICKAFGITMAQFFSGNSEIIDLTPEMSELFHNWIQLSEKNQNLIIDLVKQLNAIDN